MTKKEGVPLPGDIVQRDFREALPKEDVTSPRPLRIVQWNIERGYELPGIIAELQELDADIIGLQEIDVHCERSGGLDVGIEIARALKMNYAFACEFEELHSTARVARDQGGGVHGNAILARFGFASVNIVRHSHHPIDWEAEKHPKTKTEPRRGERLAISAVVELPTHDDALVVYSCHLEVFCGISHRLYQFSDILRDSRMKAKEGYKTQVILGDLNTMADGAVRFLPLFCSDHLRFKTLGIRESTFWKQNLFHVLDSSDQHLMHDENGRQLNRRLLQWGLEKEYCHHLINPGFQDPWDTEKDVTLQKPRSKWAYWKFVSGKLDWLLVQNLNVVEKFVGNHDYRHSDHKWLMVTATPLQK